MRIGGPGGGQGGGPADMRRFGQQIYMQTVQNRAMPLGNQTAMTDEERDALGRWVSSAGK